MTAQAAPLRRPVGRPRREFHVVLGPGSRRGRAIYWVLLALVVASAFLGSIYARIALDRTAFVLTDLEGQIATEESRYWDLRLEVSELQSPDRIAERAAELGMEYPVDIRPVIVPGIGGPGPETEERWVELKGLLSAQP
jgi:cell division protein FtsL